MSRVDLDRHLAAVAAMGAAEASRQPPPAPDCACALTGVGCCERPDIPSTERTTP